MADDTHSVGPGGGRRGACETRGSHPGPCAEGKTFLGRKARAVANSEGKVGLPWAKTGREAPRRQSGGERGLGAFGEEQAGGPRAGDGVARGGLAQRTAGGRGRPPTVPPAAAAWPSCAPRRRSRDAPALGDDRAASQCDDQQGTRRPSTPR